MGWFTDLLQGIPLNAVLKEKIGLFEQKYKDLEAEKNKLELQVATLAAENAALKQQIAEKDHSPAFVEYRGVLWKKDLDGQYMPCCPKCKSHLVQIPPGSGDILRCKPCRFDAPFHPDQINYLAQSLPK